MLAKRETLLINQIETFISKSTHLNRDSGLSYLLSNSNPSMLSSNELADILSKHGFGKCFEVRNSNPNKTVNLIHKVTNQEYNFYFETVILSDSLVIDGCLGYINEPIKSYIDMLSKNNGDTFVFKEAEMPIDLF